MILRIIISSILLAFISFTNPMAAASFNETALLILKNSPEFKLDFYSLESLSKNLATESNLPDPEIGGEYLVAPPDEDNRWALELSWGLEWPGVYTARGKQARYKLSAAEKSLMAKRAEKLAEIKDLLLDFIRTQKKLEILEELSQNNDTIYQLAQQAARGGEMTVLDLNKIQLEYANIKVARALLLDEKAEIISSLNQIYGAGISSLLDNMPCEFPPLMMPSQEDIELIKQNAPAILVAQAEAETAKAGKEVAKMEALPSISFGYKHAFEDANHFNGAMLGLSIPLFSSRGKKKAAEADIVSAEFKVEASQLEIENEAIAYINRLEIITRQINEIAPIIENADYNNALLKAYKGKVITLIEYIADRNYFTNAAVELVSLRHNAAKAMVFLQRYTSPLQM